MPIKVSCHCGQSFTAKDELKGQTLLCPKCHQPLTIGAEAEKATKPSGGMDDLFEEAGLKAVKGQRCPQCGAGLKPNALLCVECGFNLETGQRIKGARIRKTGEQGHGEAAEVLLERAERTIQEGKAEVKKNLSQGFPAWFLFLALAAVISFAGTMLAFPLYEALWYTGNGLVGLGGLIVFVYWIRLVIAGFMESVAYGLMCLFVLPLPVYIIMRWKNVSGLVIMLAVGGAFIGVGIWLQVISPSFVPEEENSFRPLPRSAPSVASLPVEETDGFRQGIA